MEEKKKGSRDLCFLDTNNVVDILSEYKEGGRSGLSQAKGPEAH